MITLTFPFSCVVCMCVGARTHTCPLCVWSPKVDIEKHSQPLFTALSVESLSQTYSLPAWLLLKPACSGHPSSAVPEAGPSARHHVYGFQNLGFELWLAHLCSNPLTLAHLCSFFFFRIIRLLLTSSQSEGQIEFYFDLLLSESQIICSWLLLAYFTSPLASGIFLVVFFMLTFSVVILWDKVANRLVIK